MTEVAGGKPEIRAQDAPAEGPQIIIRDSPFVQLTQGIQILIQIIMFALLVVCFFIVWSCYHRLGEILVLMNPPHHRSIEFVNTPFITPTQ